MNGRAVLGPTQLCFGYRMEIPQTAAGTQHCILYPADVVCLYVLVLNRVGKS